MKESIVIIDAVSSAANYIRDIKELGYNPVCLELLVDKPDEERFRKLYDKHYLLLNDELPKVLLSDTDYEKTLEKVKKVNPILIIPGSDLGIEWATRMAHDLGLPSNNPDNIKRMIDKQYMQEALKESNLRYIRSNVINSYEEAEKFISSLYKPEAVVKPSFSSSTRGVCICKNEEEIQDAISYNKKLFENEDDVDILIQEYIEGEEFYIDSICCKGHNRAVAACHYKKVLIEGKGAIYDLLEYIDESDPNFAELKEYNDKVISAIGVDYGITHAEYKIDGNGPVLIEINCRPSGLSQKHSLLDKVWGEHPTALSLESYLNPEECIKKSSKPLKLLRYYAIKSLIIYEEIHVRKSHIDEAFKDLESFEYTLSYGDNRVYPKTIDLATGGGVILLTNESQDKLIEDINTIKRIEKFEVEKIFDIAP